jgi:hypothetical protein
MMQNTTQIQTMPPEQMFPPSETLAVAAPSETLAVAAPAESVDSLSLPTPRQVTELSAAVGAISWLRQRQHPAGTWSDFAVAIGTSDAWVTAYAGFALAEAASARQLPARVRRTAAAGADAAADWLLANPHQDGAWGYNARACPDADSTAWAIRLLAARKRAIPPEALRLLDSRATDAGFTTFQSSKGRWAEPTPDVTAVVLLAQLDAGVIHEQGLVEQWRRLVAPAASPRDTWKSLWWLGEAYPTAVAVEAWAAGGRPDLRPIPVWADSPSTTFEQALSLSVAANTFGSAADTGIRRSELLAARLPDGGWAGDAQLRIPSQRRGEIYAATIDGRGVFTTATALRGLIAVTKEPTGAVPILPKSRQSLRPRPGRDQAGSAYDELIGDLAGNVGADAGSSVAVFRALTRESLAQDAPWPSNQLSSLAGGLPLELSVTSGPPALRYAVEVGVPTYPPHLRLASGLQAVGRVASSLGMSEAWREALMSVHELVSPDLPVREGRTFWLWAGVDTRAGASTLKTYLSLHAPDVPGSHGRLVRVLQNLGAPPQSPVFDIIERLERVGFCHELGLGISPDGRIGAKVYYELKGWRPKVVAAVLADAGLPADPSSICPEIPGILRESLALKQRAGIAVRVRPTDGSVPEVTVAAEFPPPLIGAVELASRVGAWLASVGDDRTTHDAIAARLLSGWRGDRSRKLHSMFTRSRTADSVTNTVYLRPAYPCPGDR